MQLRREKNTEKNRDRAEAEIIQCQISNGDREHHTLWRCTFDKHVWLFDTRERTSRGLKQFKRYSLLHYDKINVIATFKSRISHPKNIFVRISLTYLCYGMPAQQLRESH